MIDQRSMLDKIDDAVFSVEKWIIASFFTVMSVVVFADVMHRVFSNPRGRMAALWGFVGVDPQSSLAQDILGPGTLAVLAVFVIYAAFRERWGFDSSRLKALGYALVVTVVLAVAIRGFIAFFPYGLIWSQTLALCMMLWIGMLGASMAAKQRRHLALEFGSKLWPEKLQKPIRILAGVVVAIFCLFLAYLAFTLIEDEYADYDPAYGTGVFQAVALPKFIVFMALPYGFIMIVFRYFRGQLQGGDVDELAFLVKPESEEAAK